MTTATPNASAFESRLLPLDQLIDCPLNKRQIDPDSADLHELGASLKHRQEVDLIVRPGPGPARTYEVLDGKRRRAAARLVGLPALWCQVREPCTDEDAIKVIIVTQLHRANLDPMSEAGLVRQLIDGGMTHAACAAELGRPVAWVAKRAALSGLTAAWSDPATRPAWASIGYLEIIAPLPAQVQDEIAKDYAEAWRRPHSIDEFEHEIRERYLHQLKHAPWKLDDLAVLAKAGACTTCAKRSQCQTDLFGTTDADRCLDAVCWSEKLDAHNAGKARALAEKHPRVLLLTSASENAQPAPAKLPANAIALRRTHGVEDCKKSDEGALPVLDVETGKPGWVRIAPWADKKIRTALGLEDERPASGGKPDPTGTTVTAEQRRAAKRMTLRLRQAIAALGDCERPDLPRVVRLYTVFCAAAQSTLDPRAWRDAETMPDDEISDLLWQEVTNTAANYGAVRAGALPDEEAIAALERLATLDPTEQAAKALAEIPEPKRKG